MSAQAKGSNTVQMLYLDLGFVDRFMEEREEVRDSGSSFPTDEVIHYILFSLCKFRYNSYIQTHLKWGDQNKNSGLLVNCSILKMQQCETVH